MLARFFLITAALCLIMAPAAFADLEDAAAGRVFIEILPTVDVNYYGGDIDMGSAQAQDQICVTLTFSVHANGQDIAIRGGATKLFKDDIPSSQFSIPVDSLTEATIRATYGEIHGMLPTLEMSGDVGPYTAVMIYHTDWMNYGSGDPGTWSYDVDLYICWHGNDAELFQGDYSGGVILWAQYLDI
jgi:hypothetical protein